LELRLRKSSAVLGCLQSASGKETTEQEGKKKRERKFHIHPRKEPHRECRTRLHHQRESHQKQRDRPT